MVMSMKSIARTVTRITDEICPKCGNHLMKVITPHGSKTVCNECVARKNNEQERAQVRRAIEQRRFDIFNNVSMFSSQDMRHKTLANFEIDPKNSEQLKGKAAIEQMVVHFKDHQPAHCILGGKTGTGKSHLAMALCNELLAIENYKNEIVFVSWNDFVSKGFRGWRDRRIAEEIERTLDVLKTADFVVLDDLGAELTGVSPQEKSQDIAWLLQILDARTNKSMLITTNLSSGEIQHHYGERALSRILSNMTEDLIVTFKNTKDYRKRLIF